jgi:hypothetical protein
LDSLSQLVVSSNLATTAVHLSIVKLLFGSVQCLIQQDDLSGATWHHALESSVLDTSDKQVHNEGVRLLSHLAQAPAKSSLHVHTVALLTKMAHAGCPIIFAEAWLTLRHYAAGNEWLLLPFLDLVPAEQNHKLSKTVASKLLCLCQGALSTLDPSELDSMRARMLVGRACLRMNAVRH